MSYPQDNKSTHIPSFSGNVHEVDASGELVVDTGLVEVQSAVASLAQDSVATAAGVSIECGEREDGGTVKATIKTWAADGATAGSTAAKVAWMALGSK